MKRAGVRLTGPDPELLRHGLILFIAISVVNLSNFIFHVAMSRVLGPASYGTLTGLLSIFVWISICVGAVQLVVARHVAVLRADADVPESASAFLRLVFRRTTVGSGALALLLGLLSPWISDFLALPSTTSAILLAAYVLPAALSASVRGALQGRLQFHWLAGVTAGTTILRLLLGVLLVQMGLGVTGAVAATVAAEIIGFVSGLVPLRGNRSLAAVDHPLVGRLRRELITAIAAIGGFWAIVNLDTVLVRHYFPDAASGHYAAAAVAARLVLFFPVAIGTAAFPHFSAATHADGGSRRMLYQSLAVVAILSLAVAAVLGLFPSLVVQFLFGSDYLPGRELLVVLATGMVLFSMVNLFVHYWLATGSPVVWVMVPAMLVQTAAIAVFHDSPLQVAVVMLVLAASLAAAGSLVVLMAKRSGQRGIDGAVQDPGSGVLIDHTPV